MSGLTPGSPRDRVIEARLAKPESAEDYQFGDEVAALSGSCGRRVRCAGRRRTTRASKGNGTCERIMIGF